MWLRFKITTAFSKSIAYSRISSQLWFFYLLMEIFAYFSTRSCNWFIIFTIIHCNISVYTFYGNKRYMLLKPQNFEFFKWKSIRYNEPHTFWVFFCIILAYQVKQIALWWNVATSSKSTKCGLLATNHHIFWKKIWLVTYNTYHNCPRFSSSQPY